jgi:hypothetical protein
MTNKGKCRSCGAAVYWLRNDSTGNLSPIEAEPAANGNLKVDLEAGTYRVIRKLEDSSDPRYINHFATCPNSARHHKRAPA